MQRRFSFDEHYVAFLFGNGIMTHALRHDEQLAFAQLDGSIFHLDAQSSLQYQEQLIFVFMTVPGERALRLRDLDVGVVDFRDDTR
jgi:hypothetical protein